MESENRFPHPRASRNEWIDFFGMPPGRAKNMNM